MNASFAFQTNTGQPGRTRQGFAPPRPAGRVLDKEVPIRAVGPVDVEVNGFHGLHHGVHTPRGIDPTKSPLCGRWQKAPEESSRSGTAMWVSWFLTKYHDGTQDTERSLSNTEMAGKHCAATGFYAALDRSGF